MAELRNHRFLVNGATGGLGVVHVEALNGKGSEVIAIGRSGPYGLDITSEDARRQLCELIVAQLIDFDLVAQCCVANCGQEKLVFSTRDLRIPKRA